MFHPESWDECRERFVDISIWKQSLFGPEGGAFKCFRYFFVSKNPRIQCRRFKLKNTRSLPALSDECKPYRISGLVGTGRTSQILKRDYAHDQPGSGRLNKSFGSQGFETKTVARLPGWAKGIDCPSESIISLILSLNTGPRLFRISRTSPLQILLRTSI